MHKNLLALIVLSMLSMFCLGAKIREGSLLPKVLLNGNAGRMEVVDGDIEYRTWSTSNLTGKVRTVYHLAARKGIDSINQKYIDAVDSENLSPEKYQTLIILNIDDVFPLGKSFARKGFEDSRKERNPAEYVLDDDSKVRKAWDLKNKGSAVIITGKDGKVLQFKDGALTTEEIKKFIESIKSSL